MTWATGKWGRGICKVKINGHDYFKFHSNRGGKYFQKCFKTHEEARLFAIEFYANLGIPVSYYSSLIDFGGDDG